MQTGYKPRVVIFCHGYEVEKQIQPIKTFRADIVIGFHNYFDADPLANVRRCCADEFEKLLSEYKPGIEYHAFSTDLYDYSELSRKLESLIDFISKRFGGSDIYINISSGTPEFASAATMAAHYHENVRIFSVREKESNADPELVMKMISNAGKACGISKTVNEPELLQISPTSPPDRILVESLRILANNSANGNNLPAKDMIALLKERGLWLRGASSASDNVYYLRDYVEKWIGNGWVIKGNHRNTYLLTAKGKMILKTFYNEDESLEVLNS